MGLFHLFKKDKYRSSTVIPAGAPAADCYSYHGTVEGYFRQLLQGCFPDCCVRQKIRVEQLFLEVEPGEYAPVSFLLYRNDRPKVAVLLCSKADYDLPSILNTIRACRSRGITAQRYFKEFRNDASYVCSRISEALR